MIYLQNTRTKTKEAFEPLDPSHVKMYVCGPTVYATPHIGNARPPVVFDVLYRLLKETYPKVTYVNNITDVDDKINAQAKESNISIRDLTDHTVKLYKEIIGALDVLPPDHMPRVTDHIPEIIHFIEKLIELKFAYVESGHVLFEVGQYKHYGKFSNKTLDQLIDGARVEVAPYKKDPRDFVLWKPSDEETPGWESPWGKGRPGWHIECSALIKSFLGETIDIHGGGLDLMFPHHENEIAQSNCLHDGNPLAKYWLHNGHITINGVKMSKSLGNIVLLEDVLKEHNGEVVRLTLLSAHYRQPLDWTRKRTQSTSETLKKFYNALADYSGNQTLWNEKLLHKFVSALQDDLNIPLGLSIMHEITGLIHKADNVSRETLQSTLKKCGALLGILQKDYQKGLSEEEEALLEKRVQARKDKNFSLSDQLRDQLKELGVVVEDTKEGQKWNKI
jgi:cysteinyl-tRNA synthetase